MQTQTGGSAAGAASRDEWPLVLVRGGFGGRFRR
jgi:hypothetical protein